MNVTESRISGTLYMVEGFTDYSEDTDLQSGHYLALAYEADENAEVTVTLLNEDGTEEEAVMSDNDPNFVIRITNPLTQKLKITSELADHTTNEKVYRLSGLRLSADAAPDNG